ncbi:MAG: alpha/beta fold hydrolase [Polymorphobacter sp.]
MIAVPGGELAVERLGAGPPLLLLHGWTLDRRMWLPQLPLGADYTLVGIDRRGFGQATANADLAAEPDDVLLVADVLGWARFHLLGMSQGGRVALALAARAPGRLLSLTLQGTALDGVPGDGDNVPIAAMTANARRGDLAELRALVRNHDLMRTRTALGTGLVDAMLEDYAARDLLAAARDLPATADCIAGAAFPVTAIVGAADTAQRRANAQALADAGAVAVELPDAGHLCNIDSPERFNAAVRSCAGGANAAI